MELRQWIKESREAAKLTQEQLGEALGRGKATISGWEKGTYEPSYDQVIAIYERTFRKVPLPSKDGPTPELQLGSSSELPAPVAELVRAVVVAAEKGVPVEGLTAACRMFEVMAEMASVRSIDNTSTGEESPSDKTIDDTIQTIGVKRRSGADSNERDRTKRRHGT